MAARPRFELHGPFWRRRGAGKRGRHCTRDRASAAGPIFIERGARSSFSPGPSESFSASAKKIQAHHALFQQATPTTTHCHANYIAAALAALAALGSERAAAHSSGGRAGTWTDKPCVAIPLCIAAFEGKLPAAKELLAKPGVDVDEQAERVVM